LDFIVSEKEELALEALNERDERPAERGDDVVIAHPVSRQSLEVAEESVGVERFVFSLIEHLAVIAVGAAPGRQAELHGAFAAGIRAKAGGRNAHLLDGVNARGGEGKEACAAALEALGVVVHAVQRDVERGVGETVVSAVPITAGSHIARDQRGEVKTVAAYEGQV